MEGQHTGIYDSGNINAKWLENIFENIKKIEEFERLAREGCTDIFNYVTYPIDNRQVFLIDVQYKNIKLLFNEFMLVVPDISPVIGKVKADEFFNQLKFVKHYINRRELFIKDTYSDVQKRLFKSELTELFHKTLTILHELRVDLINLCSNILYVPPNGR